MGVPDGASVRRSVDPATCWPSGLLAVMRFFGCGEVNKNDFDHYDHTKFFQVVYKALFTLFFPASLKTRKTPFVMT